MGAHQVQNGKPVSKRAPWPAEKVELRPIAKLIPAARNARTHSPAQVQDIAGSITQWGWTNPILVDESGKMIAGHGRVLAAELLGVEQVPVMVAAGWTEAQKRAYAIADNKIATNADWDPELLALELSDLRADDFDLSLTGFDDVELDELLAEHSKIPEKAEKLKAKKFMRVLVSVPVDSAIDAREILQALEKTPGVEIDYGAN